MSTWTSGIFKIIGTAKDYLSCGMLDDLADAEDASVVPSFQASRGGRLPALEACRGQYLDEQHAAQRLSMLH